jgi:hypothetical protein
MEQITAVEAFQLVAAAIACDHIITIGAALVLDAMAIEVGAFYWADLAPDIVTSRREEQGSISV